MLKELINRFLRDVNYRILLVEMVLFSTILGGSLPHLWFVGCLVFAGLIWVLNKPKGVFYMIYILSAGWALIGTLFIYFLSGWGWAAGWGAFILLSSLGLHFGDLKQPLYEPPVLQNREEEDFPFLRRLNLN